MANTNKLTARQQLSRLSPLSITIVILFAAAMTYFLIRSFAATGSATLYTNPAGTQSVTTGQTFTVDVRINSGSEPVTDAAVYLSYPTSKLQVLGETFNGPYATTLANSNSEGILRMDRAVTPPDPKTGQPPLPTGDQIFAQISFKALATGSAPITFTDSSAVLSGIDDHNFLTQKTGVTYNINAPATPPPSTPTTPTTPSGGSSGSSSGSSSTKPSSGSTSSGSTKSPSGSTTGSSTANGGSGGGTATTPGATTSDDPDQTSGEVTGDSKSSAVQITILDSDNKPVAGAKVTVDGQTATTDKNGIARFDGVSAGKQTLAVNYNGKKTTKAVDVKGASTSASPELFKVSIKSNKLNPAVLIVPVLILLVAGVFFLRPSLMRFAKAPVGPAVDPDLVVTSNHPRPISPQPQPQMPVAPQHPVDSSAQHKSEAPGTVYAPQPSKDAAPTKGDSETKD